MKSKRFETSINVRVQNTDREKLAEVAERLRLEESEIARRALRVGLQFFKNVDLPGSEVEIGK